MVVLLSAAGTVAAVGLLGYLIFRGFRDGDEPSDVTVRAQSAFGSSGGLRVLDVEIHNPAASTALVALALRPAWRPLRTTVTVARRTVGRRLGLVLADQTVGAVIGGDTASFRLRSESSRRPLRLEVVVGTRGRLRLHRIHVPGGTPRAIRDPTPSRTQERSHATGAPK
jgi:hypothetical protein